MLVDLPHHLYACDKGHVILRHSAPGGVVACSFRTPTVGGSEATWDYCGLEVSHLLPEVYPEVYAAYRLAGMDAAERVWQAGLSG